MKLLGFDPGYRRFGVAVASVLGRTVRFEAVRVVSTERGEGKRTADMRGRMEVIALALAEACTADVVALCIEAGAPPFGRTQTSVLTGLGRARGLVDMLAAVMRLPVVELSPMALKKGVTGNHLASKQEVEAEMQVRFPELKALWPRLEADHQHAADAAGAIVAGLHSDNVREAIRARRVA